MTVRFGDLDLRGHLNNVALVRMLETARVEYLVDVGLGDPWQFRLAVVSMQVSFRSPAYYRDPLVCGVRVHTLGRTSMGMTQGVWHVSDDQLVADAEVTLVSLDAANGPTPLPAEWRAKLTQWEPELRGAGRAV